MAKVKTIKAKGSRVKVKKRKSKGALYPWEVRAVNKTDGFHWYSEGFKTRAQAVKFLRESPKLLCPVIVHVDISPMEY